MFRSKSARSLQFLLIFFLLSGCATSEPVDVNYTPPRPPDQAMQLCKKDLPNAKGPTRKEVLEARAETARQMITCAERHRTLRNYIQDIVSVPK